MLTLFPRNKKNIPDDELLRNFQSSGDTDLLGELFSRYMHLVYGVCLKYLENREDSKDAVIQIFEKLLSDLPDYEIRNFKSYLYVLTKNYCLMQLRSQQSTGKKIKIWEKEQEIFMESESLLHPVDEENPELNKALMDCIEKLKIDQKECINWFYFENKSYREIAELPGFDEKKVKSLLQNAKRNLKICLENKHVEKV